MSDCLPFSLVKGLMSEARLPAMENQRHIVPVRVGDPVHCKAVTDSLLNHYRVYVLPINGAARHGAHALHANAGSFRCADLRSHRRA